MMTMTGTAKSPWTGALIAAGALAIVSGYAALRGWSLGSWLWAAGGCVVAGAVAAVEQARRNRRLDRAARQAAAVTGAAQAVPR